MPPKKSNIGRSTRNAQRLKTIIDNETPQQREIRLEENKIRASSLRAAETDNQRNVRVANLRKRASTSRAAEEPNERAQRLDDQLLRQTRLRIRTNLNKEAFNYDKNYNYKMHPDVYTGLMDIVCEYCHAKKFKKETAGMCCSNG